MGHYNHSLSLDATIMVSKNCSIIGEHVVTTVFDIIRHSSRTTEDSSSRRIMRLVPVFTLETNEQKNNECLPNFVQTDNASSSIKTAIVFTRNLESHFERKKCFSAASSKVLCEFLTEAKISVFVVE